MKKFIALTAVAATMALGAPAVSAKTTLERSEERVAKLLEGRVAGEASNCISALRSNDIQVIPHVGVAYEQGDTVYLARVRNPNSLRSSDVPIFERFGSQLCTTDIVRTADRYSGFTTGVVFLDDFVAYTKANG